MNRINFFAPQWQGSGLTRELYDGALALKDFISQNYDFKVLEIPVRLDGTPFVENGILGFREITAQLMALQEVLEREEAEKTLLLGGGCGLEIPFVSRHLFHDRDLALYWFDAHGDLNSPETSTSHHFHGMPLRYLTQNLPLHDSINILRADPSRVILMGSRDLDTPEEHFIRENSIRVMGPECFPLHRALENEVLPSSERAYIHIDLDVLDPAEFRNVKCPVREGITLEDLCASVEKISELHEVAGISILENTETRPAELELLRDLLDSCMRILDNKHSC